MTVSPLKLLVEWQALDAFSSGRSSLLPSPVPSLFASLLAESLSRGRNHLPRRLKPPQAVSLPRPPATAAPCSNIKRAPQPNHLLPSML
ncbi:hypothetical protein BJQ97_02660 [Geobacillus sp. TFV-3]|nr:hypothetical protein BJQ97_02660 [Geobacillus sp. TFV-3]